MTGFNNVLNGVAHFFQRLGGEIGDDAKDAATAVINFLHPSIVAVENEINEHGPELMQAVTTAMATAALAAVTGGAGTAVEIASAAGRAAIAAGEAAAAAAGKTLAVDALHALATAAVTQAKAAAPAAAPAG